MKTITAGMSLQNHCEDEEDSRIGLFSWLHYVCIMLFALCFVIHMFELNEDIYLHCEKIV